MPDFHIKHEIIIIVLLIVTIVYLHNILKVNQWIGDILIPKKYIEFAVTFKYKIKSKSSEYKSDYEYRTKIVIVENNYDGDQVNIFEDAIREQFLPKLIHGDEFRVVDTAIVSIVKIKDVSTINGSTKVVD